MTETITTPEGIDPAEFIAAAVADGARKPRKPPVVAQEASKPKRHTERYEYLKEFLADEPEPPKGETRRTPAILDAMNARGAEGWEVFSMKEDMRNVRHEKDMPAVRVMGYIVFWKRKVSE